MDFLKAIPSLIHGRLEKTTSTTLKTTLKGDFQQQKINRHEINQDKKEGNHEKKNSNAKPVFISFLFHVLGIEFDYVYCINHILISNLGFDEP